MPLNLPHDSSDFLEYNLRQLFTFNISNFPDNSLALVYVKMRNNGFRNDGDVIVVDVHITESQHFFVVHFVSQFLETFKQGFAVLTSVVFSVGVNHFED